MAVLAPRDVQFFLTAEEFREWLRANHDRADEVWVAFRKKSSQLPSISYVDAVDEALCFGWIDGIQKPLDAETYCHRFTPRSRRSRWSERNTGRFAELEAMGRVHASGRRAYEARDIQRDREYPSLLDANEAARSWFGAQSASYRKAAAWWVMSAKREETRRRRVQTLIEASANGRRMDAPRPGDPAEASR